MAEVDVSGDRGVLKTVTKEGTGKVPKRGEIVFAHYTGRLEDGTVFDSSVGKKHRAMGFFFQLGAGAVIKGWDVGFESMKVGEEAILKCRPDYAYGSGGGGPIPPNATLSFEVQLLDSKTMSRGELDALEQEVARLRQG
mmetsp:Transcript_36634/g.80270  ORF Transcript_36634/g.80270 Transcript_36634/m.80270 type:complete len:139 (-) Transcript_36634:131-547(-)|eukprot:CAMPEP_0170630866 /NCGR_PEP_ID=MMETSP0224-20130122/34267_1 /TAXON_ID=285029 /ORGANISM="Togula jolla, Strain CCCM 725" /LENGTH=138 /DNA_ID=CAMNT_0010959029 /DNA_START=78 /DNA_END=494 /DNA_ORIENTATION=-